MLVFTLLSSHFSVRVQVRFTLRGSVFDVRPQVPGCRRARRPPNLNTNREARTKKCERRYVLIAVDRRASPPTAHSNARSCSRGLPRSCDRRGTCRSEEHTSELQSQSNL